MRFIAFFLQSSPSFTKLGKMTDKGVNLLHFGSDPMRHLRKILWDSITEDMKRFGSLVGGCTVSEKMEKEN